MNYNKYKQLYKKKAEYMKAHGYTMFDKMYSKARFTAMYEAAYNTRAEMKANGQISEIGNVYKQMVEDQQWDRSLKQAQHTKAMIKEQFGMDYTIAELRSPDFKNRHPEYFKKLEEVRQAKYKEIYKEKIKELKGRGYNEEVARQMASKYAGQQSHIFVSQTYYGSN